ncbi:unnamed protein product [Pedinophyceae sp. YPF-701]|nr:unnamed protein product [Pedinophyceae sp. YPF-701]
MVAAWQGALTRACRIQLAADRATDYVRRRVAPMLRGHFSGVCSAQRTPRAAHVDGGSLRTRSARVCALRGGAFAATQRAHGAQSRAHADLGARFHAFSASGGQSRTLATHALRHGGCLSRAVSGSNRHACNLREMSQSRSFNAAVSLPRIKYWRAGSVGAGASMATAPCALPLQTVVVDFDETLTETDTTFLLGQLAAESAGPAGSSERARREQEWAAAVDNYSAKYAEWSRNHPFPSAAEPGWLQSWYAAADTFDKSMVAAVSEPRVLRGIPAEVLRTAAADRVQLRPGAAAALRALARAGVPLSVLSVNFSSEMICACLRANGVVSEAGRKVAIFANDLAVDDAGATTGEVAMRCNSGSDKRVRMRALLAAAAAQCAPGLSAYVGDSAGDVPAMLLADVPILVGQSGSARKAIAAAGARLVPLSGTDPSQIGGRTGPLVVYEAAGWDEIGALFEALAGARSGEDTASSAAPRAPRNMPRVLSIAGSDSGGGAGIQADLKACEALGAFGMTAITAVTAQNTRGVHGVVSVDSGFLELQIDSCLGDIGADVIKTGMLPTPEAVRAVAAAVDKHGVRNVVVDPVLVATSGDALAESDSAHAMREELFPRATIITPNVPEAEALLGRKIATVDDMRMAARDLHAMGPRWVLVKGGHLVGSEDMSGGVVDVLFDGVDARDLEGSLVASDNTHGTGCTLASSIAAGLARGMPVEAAVRAAKQYIQETIAASAGLGTSLGDGVQRPLLHGSALRASRRVASRRAGASAAAAAQYLKVYGVTDPGCDERTGRGTEEQVRRAVEGGATIIQLREKEAGGGDFVRQARAALAVCRAHGVPLIINDRVDVALAVGADGVHVGQSDMPARDVRALIGPDRILGVSCKSPPEAHAAEADGADYIGVGAVTGTPTKKDSNLIGMGGLKEVCRSTCLPVVAIGGVDAGNAAECIAAGAQGVAVVRAIFEAADPAAAARELLEIVEGALEQQLR